MKRKIKIVTPQFEREPGRPGPLAPPKTVEQWKKLSKLDVNELKKLGLRPWAKHKKETLWLFPGEWYPHIPDGLKITDIFFHEEQFESGKTDDDIRFGCLAYGVLATAPKKKK